MNDKKAIVFVGMPGAGKSVCVEYLKNKGLPYVYFGGITIDEVKARGLEVNEVNEKLVREDIRAREGKGAYAVRILQQIQKLFDDGNDNVVVDGIYSWTEYKIFKETLGENAIIIGVVTPRALRHQRLANRPIRPFTSDEANSRDYAEIENIEKGGPIANADYYLTNSTSREAIETELAQLLSSIGLNF